MSHYTVAVFTKKGQYFEDLLEPFNENIEVEPYVSKTKEELIEEAKNIKEKILERMKDPNYKIDNWERKYLDCRNDEDYYKANTWSDDEYDEDDSLLSTYNPNSKWDWYVIGGRWKNSLKTKDGNRVDSCLVKDLDLDLDINSNEYINAVRFWELIIEKQPLKEGGRNAL